MIHEQLQDSDREQFIITCLNTKNEPTNISVVSVGTLNKAIVHPKEVFKTAILSNAASSMAFHNHPSGNAEPSQQDIQLTNRLYEAGELLGIKLLDHLIIGDGTFTSLKEKGALCQMVWVKKFYRCNREELSCSLSDLIPFIFLFKGVLVDD